jgi:hypothetical protein
VVYGLILLYKHRKIQYQMCFSKAQIINNFLCPKLKIDLAFLGSYMFVCICRKAKTT